MTEKPLFRRAVMAVWLVSVAVTVYVSLRDQIELPVDFWNADKLYHALAYAWLGGLPLWAFANGERARAAAYCMIPLGGLLEWGQSFLPARSASMGDAVANALGVFVGLWLSEALMRRCRDCQGVRG
uniref:Putative integral membrane protein n=1 Tax=Desulfovibrio sp. U5L TaxID=596152 RepID=I2PYZ6_9BACT